jgi:preprotein translocase subunit SecB
MQEAAFSIVNYQFDKVHIDLANPVSKALSLSFDTKGVFINESSTYELVFIVCVSNKEEEAPFITIQCKGIFKFENVSKLEEIPNFFYQNSIAILFPYVRAYLSIVTMQANIPGIILPTLNLSNLESDLRKNTTQK